MPLLKSKQQKVDCLVTLPNSLVHYVSISENGTGSDCIEKICSILGIVEIDYFGLRYVDHHGMYVWLNNRMKISSQIKASSSSGQPGGPYQLHLRVKYFVDPKLILQPSTRYVFVQEVKSILLKGQLPVGSQDAGKIGALLAQVEFGDSTDQMCYPKYFKEWNPGISREIYKHHSSLKGISQQEAEQSLLNEVFKLENWGVSYLKVINLEDNTLCFVGLGGFHIRLCNSQWKMIKKISYSALLEASFRNKVFSILYRSLNSQGEVTDKRLFLQCQSHRIARYMFRLLTEDHTFFTHEVVNERVKDHKHQTKWQSFCKRYLGCKYDPKYHFDVIRTQHEAYTRAWEQLHQLDQNELNNSSAVLNSFRGRAAQQTTTFNGDGSNSSGSNHQRQQLQQQQHMREREIDVDSITVMETETFPVSPSSPTRSSDLFRFGLSNSCCDIAKQLLQDNCSSSITDDEQDQSADEVSSCEGGAVVDARNSPSSYRKSGGSSVCMTKEGTEKLEQFIQKIVDSKICRVCMDNPVSAVFCPCGHYMTCYQCALECKRCPLCRKEVAYVQYVYGTSS